MTICLNTYAAALLSRKIHSGTVQMHNQKWCVQQRNEKSENIIRDNRYMQCACMVKILCSSDEEIPKGTSWTKCYCRNVNAFHRGKGNSPDGAKLRQGHTLEKSSMCCLPCPECLPYVHSNVAMAHKHTHTLTLTSCVLNNQYIKTYLSVVL